MTKDQNAPGRLNRVREFVNTIDFEKPGPPDELSEASATAWLTGFGFPEPLSDEDLASLREFREAIRAILLANNGDGDPDLAWRRLAELAPRTAVDIVLEPEGGCRLAPCTEGGAAAIKADLLATIYDAVRDETWHRMKACKKDTCLWAFFDHSKNGSGAWCSMATCGNRVKAQRRRRKQPPLPSPAT